jgi:uncharacterized hydantoinase/oxoprolinase family protein
MRANFIKKRTTEDLIPQDEYIIEKEVILSEEDLNRFIERQLGDYGFLREYIVQKMECITVFSLHE